MWQLEQMSYWKADVGGLSIYSDYLRCAKMNFTSVKLSDLWLTTSPERKISLTLFSILSVQFRDFYLSYFWAETQDHWENLIQPSWRSLLPPTQYMSQG